MPGSSPPTAPTAGGEETSSAPPPAPPPLPLSHPPPPRPPDLVRKYSVPFLELLLRFGDDILDAVHRARAGGLDVETVRTAVLGPVRDYLRALKEPDDMV